VFLQLYYPLYICPVAKNCTYGRKPAQPAASKLGMGGHPASGGHGMYTKIRIPADPRQQLQSNETKSYTMPLFAQFCQKNTQPEGGTSRPQMLAQQLQALQKFMAVGVANGERLAGQTDRPLLGIDGLNQGGVDEITFMGTRKQRR